ncbi:cytochrome b/b6 domain-containing protein [Salinimonas chungwhensis]|uniref:cytochrome b/b6 domain-containing protein n=1 Tax=Salinimonas chungwhensis TaxID=265425 RepID=UPI0003817143|nr:cytochrome b/b6 domain-containing protein [Salinimonas chungwhensis]
MRRRLIWDIPTRLFHWLLVGALLVQYVTATWMDNAMQWHFYTGYFVLGLLTFRILWGLVGPTHARFASFVTSPVQVFRYGKTLFRQNSHAYGGHNPLGGYVVILMLALLISQAVSGLFMTDDIFMEGPWYPSADESLRDLMNYLHRAGVDWLLIIIGLHISAVIFYKVYKKQALTSAMLHGKKQTEAKAISSSKLLLAGLLMIISAALTWYVVAEAPPETESEDVFY